MFHSKFQDLQVSGPEVFSTFGGGDHLESCDLDHLCKVSFPLPRGTPYEDCKTWAGGRTDTRARV